MRFDLSSLVLASAASLAAALPSGSHETANNTASVDTVADAAATNKGLWKVIDVSINLDIAHSRPSNEATRQFESLVITDPLLQYMPIPRGYQDFAWDGCVASSFVAHRLAHLTEHNAVNGVQLVGHLPNGFPVVGLAPHSGKNAAVLYVSFSFYSRNDLEWIRTLTRQQRRPSTGGVDFVTVTGAQGSFLVYNEAGQRAPFDMAEFWFGCALSSPESVVQEAQSCVVDVEGWRWGEKKCEFFCSVASRYQGGVVEQRPLRDLVEETYLRTSSKRRLGGISSSLAVPRENESQTDK